MKICGSCGGWMPDEAVSCSLCGASLEAGQIPEQPYQQDDQSYDSIQQNDYYQKPYVQPVYSENSFKGMAIASLVLGILSLLTGTIAIGFILGVLGCIFGIKARNQISEGLPGRGMATAGLICSIIGIVYGGIVLASCTCVACIAAMNEMMILGGVI